MNNIQLHNGQIFDLDRDLSEYSFDQIREYAGILSIEHNNVKNFKATFENQTRILYDEINRIKSEINKLTELERDILLMVKLMEGRLSSQVTKKEVVEDIIKVAIQRFGYPYLRNEDTVYDKEYFPKAKILPNGNPYIMVKLPPANIEWNKKTFNWAMQVNAAFDSTYIEWGTEETGFKSGYLHIRITHGAICRHKNNMQTG